MFKKITIAIALSTAISSPVFAHGDEDGHCKDTQLGSVMSEMSDDLKAYVSAFKRGDQAAMQVQLTKLLANSAKAKDEIPLKLQQDIPPMEGMDHGNMTNMKGMNHSTHMQHMAYQQGMEKLTHLFNQLQKATSKGEVKTALGSIKQYIKKSHKVFRLNCD
ncbi:copper resistance protein CopA [Moritella viscosa]|uniref:Copper resistance protein A n=1 Tax=Moritella viscosa TaxID=80854 RepID=A0A1K9ZZ34_9GAMM|nr:copper resistance protein CopA [Moritella viscosa]SGZ04908.1 Copper resistance protein A [Moritella viscosa]SHO08413.1 Copper resistance protein A [Moritella viscosa]SHO08452.1 Copper resistance protein A [Moritella viscosa]SHO12895.1 Copper resistance protein A [Moritella viscosa]SHO16404.1 Copper resistance protein A [Moritella viscosa]